MDTTVAPVTLASTNNGPGQKATKASASGYAHCSSPSPWLARSTGLGAEMRMRDKGAAIERKSSSYGSPSPRTTCACSSPIFQRASCMPWRSPRRRRRLTDYAHVARGQVQLRSVRRQPPAHSGRARWLPTVRACRKSTRLPRWPRLCRKRGK